MLGAVARQIRSHVVAALHEKTGGDYFDWQHLADRRLAVMVGDVTGHAIGSALYISAWRADARAAFANSPDLGSLLYRMNHLLHKTYLAGSSSRSRLLYLGQLKHLYN